jgi:glucokinase
MTRLIADVGGTNARFALVAHGHEPYDVRTLAVADHPGLVEAARVYLGGRPVEEAVIAVATPVETDEVVFTNSPWRFRVSALGAELGVARLAVINDFVAQALAVPHLGGDDLERLRPGAPRPERPVGVIGPGTGLGVAALVPFGRRWLPLATEGGHTSLAPGNPRELSVLEHLAEHFPHVSKERLVSGPGLVTLATTLARIDGGTCPASRPEDVPRLAAAGECPFCLEATRIFSALLGAAAGDLALTLGARGGIYVCGGVCLRLGPLFDRAAFAERFLAKGRMHAYLEPVPVWLVLRGDTGLLGAARHVLDGPA